MRTPEALIALIQSPDATVTCQHDAFRELIVQFQDMAFGCAYAILGEEALAQDATQEAFIAAYRNLGQLREPKAFPGWMRRIVLTSSYRLIRKRAPTQPLEEAFQLSSGQPDPPTLAEGQELKEQIQSAIQALPEPQRLATVLYYIDGYSQKEVADFLELSVDAVKKQLQRARQRLQERMIAMVQDDLQKRRPSRDDRLVQAVQLFTSLQVAAEQSQLATIELMLVDGLDIDACDDQGQTLLHWAARQGHVDAVELLIARGASLDIRNDAGKTPREEALEQGHLAVAELLRRGMVEGKRS